MSCMNFLKNRMKMNINLQKPDRFLNETDLEIDASVMNCASLDVLFEINTARLSSNLSH